MSPASYRAAPPRVGTGQDYGTRPKSPNRSDPVELVALARRPTSLSALVLVCTLKPSPAESSSQLLGEQLLRELEKHEVTGEVIRIADHKIKFGVEIDEGDGDEWPDIRKRLMASQILVLA